MKRQTQTAQRLKRKNGNWFSLKRDSLEAILSRFPPRVSVRLFLANWLGGRLILLLLIGASFSLLRSNLSLGVIAAVFYSVVFWIRPSMASIEKKILWSKKHHGNMPTFIQVALSLLLPSISAILSFLLGIGQVWVLLFLSSLGFWLLAFLFIWRASVKLAHGMVYVYPFFWPTLISIAILFPSSVSEVETQIVFLLVGLVSLVAFASYGSKDLAISELEEEYQQGYLSLTQERNTARIVAEEIASSTKLSFQGQRLDILDGKDLYSCFALDTSSFIVIDCRSSKPVNPRKLVKQTLWFANFSRQQSAGILTTLSLSIFKPMMDSFWEHKGESAREDMRPDRKSVERRRSTYLNEGILLSWENFRIFTKSIASYPSTKTFRQMLHRVETLNERLTILTKDGSSLSVRSSGARYRSQFAKTLSFLDECDKQVSVIGL
ncbi:MAG: hypothetical protein ABSB29_03815 [Nitrososphaerales archaeon]